MALRKITLTGSAAALTAMLKQIVANNRADGWRLLKDRL
jgi:hypothetical protein